MALEPRVRADTIRVLVGHAERSRPSLRIPQLAVFSWFPNNTVTDWADPRKPVRIVGHASRFVMVIKALWTERPFNPFSIMRLQDKLSCFRPGVYRYPPGSARASAIHYYEAQRNSAWFSPDNYSTNRIPTRMVNCVRTGVQALGRVIFAGILSGCTTWADERAAFYYHRYQACLNGENIAGYRFTPESISLLQSLRRQPQRTKLRNCELGCHGAASVHPEPVGSYLIDSLPDAYIPSADTPRSYECSDRFCPRPWSPYGQTVAPTSADPPLFRNLMPRPNHFYRAISVAFFSVPGGVPVFVTRSPSVPRHSAPLTAMTLCTDVVVSSANSAYYSVVVRGLFSTRVGLENRRPRQGSASSNLAPPPYFPA